MRLFWFFFLWIFIIPFLFTIIICCKYCFLVILVFCIFIKIQINRGNLLWFRNILKLILVLNDLRVLTISVIRSVDTIISHYLFIKVQKFLNLIFGHAWAMINFQCLNFNFWLLKKIIFLFLFLSYFVAFLINLWSIS